MDDHIVTLPPRAYRLHWTGRQLAGGRYAYTLLDGPRLDAPVVGRGIVRAWWVEEAPDGVTVPIWGWQWAGAWYDTAEELVEAVLAARQTTEDAA